jgi:hypothetical protein
VKVPMKEHERENDIKDDIIKDYNSIIRESALLTTVSGFLFGFLLNISINTPKGFGPNDISFCHNSCSITLRNASGLSSLTISLQGSGEVQTRKPQIYQIWYSSCGYYFVSRVRSWIRAGFKTWISVNEF